jgi:hypothetical protein
MKSEQEIYDEQLKEMRKIVIGTIDYDILDFIIYYDLHLKTFGVIYLTTDHYIEESDNHCAECSEEVLAFRIVNHFSKSSREILPNYCSGVVGETKFNKIKTKDFNFYGFSSDKIKIID